MQDYNFDVLHRKGALNANAVAIARPPIAQAEGYIDPEDDGRVLVVHKDFFEGAFR